MLLLAEEKSITVQCEAQPGVAVEGDPSRLKQVVVNLLDNAIRYTGEGGSIAVRTAAKNGWATLTVTDNGSGIPPEALPHVFERFYRADKARSRYSGGSGLGLSIVNAICTAHRGEVEIASIEGVGTTVTIRLRPATSHKAAGHREESGTAHLVQDWRLQ
jgi:signal transduction histidine kinase